MICGKATYHSRVAALESIKGIKKDKRPSQSKKKPVKPYFCNDCGGWHLTSNKRKHHPRRSLIKELHTTERQEPTRRLKIIDHTSHGFNNTMARVYGLLGCLLITGITATGFSDTSVEQTSTSQVIEWFDYDHYVLSSDAHKAIAFDADLTEEFVLVALNYRLPKTLNIRSHAKAEAGYVKVPRGPPDSWRKNQINKFH